MSATKPKYIIDTCSLTAMRRHYPQDVFPSAWAKLDELADSGLLLSVVDVFEELKIQDDEVLEWAKQHSGIFLPLDEALQKEVRKILIAHINLVDRKKTRSSADPFVIGAAIVHDCVVVTEEKKSGGPEKSKIPDVCDAYNVECIKVLDMLRREGLRS